jgi:hypothetical protein
MCTLGGPFSSSTGTFRDVGTGLRLRASAWTVRLLGRWPVGKRSVNEARRLIDSIAMQKLLARPFVVVLVRSPIDQDGTVGNRKNRPSYRIADWKLALLPSVHQTKPKAFLVEAVQSTKVSGSYFNGAQRLSSCLEPL